jgi:hypothetical protein
MRSGKETEIGRGKEIVTEQTGTVDEQNEWKERGNGIVTESEATGTARGGTPTATEHGIEMATEIEIVTATEETETCSNEENQATETARETETSKRTTEKTASP